MSKSRAKHVRDRFQLAFPVRFQVDPHTNIERLLTVTLFTVSPQGRVSLWPPILAPKWPKHAKLPKALPNKRCPTTKTMRFALGPKLTDSVPGKFPSTLGKSWADPKPTFGRSCPKNRRSWRRNFGGQIWNEIDRRKSACIPRLRAALIPERYFRNVVYVYQRAGCPAQSLRRRRPCRGR